MCDNTLRHFHAHKFFKCDECTVAGHVVIMMFCTKCYYIVCYPCFKALFPYQHLGGAATAGHPDLKRDRYKTYSCRRAALGGMFE